MSPSTPEQPEQPLGEELVAYLDGELTREQSEALEARLGSDELVRLELQQYDRVWNALDALPRATVGDAFTRTTIEMVSVEAEQDLIRQTALLPVRKRNRRVQLAALCLVGAMLGFTLVWLLAPHPNRTLYANLPLIAQLDAYSEVRDVEFLRALDDAAGQWLHEEWGPQVQAEAETLTRLNTASFRARRDYVETLDSEARTALAGKLARYQDLSPSARDQLRRRHETIVAADDSARLQRTMLAYYAWVSLLDEGEQAQLRLLDTTDRVARVQEIQQRRVERESSFRFTPATAMALRRAFEALATDPEIERLHERFVAALPHARDLPRPERPQDHFWQRAIEALKKSAPREATMRVLWIARFGDDVLEVLDFPMAEFTAYHRAIVARLLAALDEDTRSRFRDLDLGDRSRIFVYWLMRSRQRTKPDLATLEDYFVNGGLTIEKQQELLSMPKDQMLQTLERLWLDEYLGDSGDDEWRMRFRRGGREDRRSERDGPDDRVEREAPNGRAERRGPGDPPPRRP